MNPGNVTDAGYTKESQRISIRAHPGIRNIFISALDAKSHSEAGRISIRLNHFALAAKPRLII